jgi:hypothetical protein
MFDYSKDLVNSQYIHILQLSIQGIWIWKNFRQTNELASLITAGRWLTTPMPASRLWFFGLLVLFNISQM